jgi:predicted branched-subunit amino acid permease
VAVSTFAWRVTRIDHDEPDRLIGELRLAQWMAVLFAGASGVPIGLALARPATPLGHLDIALAAAFIAVAGFVIQRDPREGLLIASLGLVAHALVDIAHRPGWLPPDLSPRWFTAGCATYNVYLAAWCFWARHR